tara:strand:+ start:187 stop:753 length:567 start_codon:yes stop_codon:yes gene_type:complete
MAEDDQIEKVESPMKGSTKVLLMTSLLLPLAYSALKLSKQKSKQKTTGLFGPFLPDTEPPPNSPRSPLATKKKKAAPDKETDPELFAPLGQKRRSRKRSRKRTRKKSVKVARMSQANLWESSPPKPLKKMSREELIDNLARFRAAWQKKTDKHADLDDVRVHHETDDELRQLLSFYYSDAARKMSQKI